jgi:hypothetical protein
MPINDNIGEVTFLVAALSNRRMIMGMKEEYEQTLQAQLDEWNTEIDKLKAKADGAKADTQLEYYNKIEELQVMQESANNELAKLKKAGDDVWEDIKAGIDSE